MACCFPASCSIGGNLVVTDQLAPFRRLAAHEFRELLRRAADYGRAQGGDAVAQFGLREYRIDLAIELFDDGLRRSCRSVQTVPADRVVAGETLFGNSGYIRQQRRALRARDAQRPELARADVRHRGEDHVEDERHMST